jgi:hypothetical protein
MNGGQIGGFARFFVAKKYPATWANASDTFGIMKIYNTCALGKPMAKTLVYLGKRWFSVFTQFLVGKTAVRQTRSSKPAGKCALSFSHVPLS